LILRPAIDFTIEELTHGYNQTRQDYIVPMPMTSARLQEYVDAYDVDLQHSCIVLDDEDPALIIGIGMLGRRENRSWITRVGVLPYTRKLGVGGMIISELINNSLRIELDSTWLEVIFGNDPAHRLFLKNRFKETRELSVLRRPPGTQITEPDSIPSPLRVAELNHKTAIDQLEEAETGLNWINQVETFKNIKDLSIKQLIFAHGWEGRVFYEKSALQLKRVIVQIVSGPIEEVTASVLAWLHNEYPMPDAVCENFEVSDPRIKGYLRVGYFESFRRIEMVRDNNF